MAVKWTEEQKKVITLRDRNILVSAAAGSGKTAVLVQRILSKIMDPLKPVDIDRLLIMTFTRAAAGEMRERIVAFDYLRALAITGILLCHFCHNYNSISFLGHYFGGVFVTLFIAMSGMLFGIVWNNNSRMEYDMSFLKQRFFKLSVTYYPFLILMFAFLYFVDDYHFNVKNLFLINMFHFCFLLVLRYI